MNAHMQLGNYPVAHLRQIGVLCVTYGAGGHNVVNTVAGSFSGRVPGEEKRKLGVLIHHQTKEIESQFHIFHEITCATKIINDRRTAATDIDEVVQNIWRYQQPGYIEIHQDMVESEIAVPHHISEWNGVFSEASSDTRKVEESVRDTAERFQAARKPAVIVGTDAFRHKVTTDVIALVEKMGAPCRTTVLAKGAFPMDHPQDMDVHIGAISPTPICQRIEEADLVIHLGALLTDMNLGSQPQYIHRGR